MASPFQQIHFIHIHRLFISKEGDQNTKPYGSFHFRVQKDLFDAYHTAGVKPLPMRIGYGYGKAASNLLFARRTGS